MDLAEMKEKAGTALRGERSREQGTRGNSETVCANPLQASVSGGARHTGEPVQLPHFMEETLSPRNGALHLTERRAAPRPGSSSHVHHRASWCHQLQHTEVLSDHHKNGRT